MTRWWYERYAGCTSVTRCLREGLGGPESVCVNVGRVWGVVEKLGKGLGRPVEGWS